MNINKINNINELKLLLSAGEDTSEGKPAAQEEKQ
jgi:hypothetical protein